MSLLTNIFDGQIAESLVVVQTSLAVPWLPFFRTLLARCPTTIICVCILHTPDDLLPASLVLDRTRVKIIDWTANVPNYYGVDNDSKREQLHKTVLDAISSTPTEPVTLVIDSPESLRVDLDSTSVAYTCLQHWHAALTSHHASTRMVFPLPANSPLLSRVLTPSFAPSVVHLTLHPPVLLYHLATEHLVPKPPHPRFWALFSTAGTGILAERLVWGDGGSGWGDMETAVEILVRRLRGKRVEHTIEGWRPSEPCELVDLVALRGLWSARSKDSGYARAVDPARDLSFNLVLTDAQQHARAQVPLPYAHRGADYGVPKDVVPPTSSSMILYDPDSADDLDDDDPDEDLDI